MAALTAAEVENSICFGDTKQGRKQIDFCFGEIQVIYNIAISFQIEMIEDVSPPVRPEVAFKASYGAKSYRSFV